MGKYTMKLVVGLHVCLILTLISFGETYSGPMNLIDLTEEDDSSTGRIFYNNATGLAAFLALSLFPLLFLASAMGGGVLQWWLSGYNSYDKCDHYYYDSGYGGGGGYSSGHGGGYKRSDDGYDYDYKHSFQKRSTKADIELSGMCHCFLVRHLLVLFGIYLSASVAL